MVGDGDQGGMTVPPRGGEGSQVLPILHLHFSIWIPMLVHSYTSFPQANIAHTQRGP